MRSLNIFEEKCKSLWQQYNGTIHTVQVIFV